MFKDRETNDNGWIIYGRDKELRSALYSPELVERIMTHPAKQMMHATYDIIEEYTKVGDTILDPFGGVGTTLCAATLARNVVLIEIEDYYQSIIQDCILYLHSSWTDLSAFEGKDWNDVPNSEFRKVYRLGEMTLIRGDNQVCLPFPCDHIITSPPYGDDLFKGAATGNKLATAGQEQQRALNAAEMQQYATANQNIGRQPEFIYKQIMKKVYAKMVAGLRPGGTITITHRDRIKDGQRILYVDSIIRSLLDCGMNFEALRKWEVPRTIQANVNLNRGTDVVLDEDIITMRKPVV